MLFHLGLCADYSQFVSRHKKRRVEMLQRIAAGNCFTAQRVYKYHLEILLLSHPPLC